MFNVKAENLLENDTRGAGTRHRAGNEGPWLLLSFAPQDRLLCNMQVPNPQTPGGAAHRMPLKICSSLTLGESLNVPLPGL